MYNIMQYHKHVISKCSVEKVICHVTDEWIGNSSIILAIDHNIILLKYWLLFIFGLLSMYDVFSRWCHCWISNFSYQSLEELTPTSFVLQNVFRYRISSMIVSGEELSGYSTTLVCGLYLIHSSFFRPVCTIADWRKSETWKSKCYQCILIGKIIFCSTVWFSYTDRKTIIIKYNIVYCVFVYHGEQNMTKFLRHALLPQRLNINNVV